MTTEQNIKTSFRQYEFCKLCKTNHKRKKKHIYSKRHQDILSKILSKFESKTGAAKQTVFNPEVEDISFEQNAKFWCYFCEEEHEKHKRLDQCTIKYGSLLQHICGEEHVSKTVDFLWDNILKVKMKDKYILSKEHYESFKLAAAKAVVSFEENKRNNCLKEAVRIKEREKLQRASVLDGERQVCQIESEIFITCQIWHVLQKSFKCLPQTYLRTESEQHDGRLMMPYNTGPTFIDTQDIEAGGNTFPHTTQQCLLEYDQDTETDIGPSLVDYQKHLERKRKGQLSSGEDQTSSFDEETKTGEEDWFPSFESDWNGTPRSGTKKQGMMRAYNEDRVREWKGLNEEHHRYGASRTTAVIPSTFSNMPLGSKSFETFKCVPYKRKHSATVTSRSELNTATLLHTPIVQSCITEPPIKTKQLCSSTSKPDEDILHNESQKRYSKFHS